MSFQVHAKQHLRRQGNLGIGGHQSARAGTVEWLTPPEILRALTKEPYGPFDLDPCAPVRRPWPMAKRHYTVEEDGMLQEWEGRIWLNPPYGGDTWGWLRRMAEHRNGIALIFARTETDGFHHYGWSLGDGFLFFYSRLHFHHLDGTRAKGNCGGPSVLIAYGQDNVQALRDSGIRGALLPPAEMVGEAS